MRLPVPDSGANGATIFIIGLKSKRCQEPEAAKTGLMTSKTVDFFGRP
jgi:hypothetical protein